MVVSLWSTCLHRICIKELGFGGRDFQREVSFRCFSCMLSVFLLCKNYVFYGQQSNIFLFKIMRTPFVISLEEFLET